MLLFGTIINNCYSSEEEDFYNFLDNLSGELQRVRELYIQCINRLHNNEELQIIESEIKTHLSNISLKIRDNKLLFENNISLMNILKIIDYEINNILNINLINNSYEMFKKIEIFFEYIMFAYIINYYEPIISNYDL
jgi:Zn-dependent oligopeptidase